MGRILIVDDSKLSRDLFLSALGGLGHDLKTACPESLGEFLALARDFLPSLVLLDYKLGDLSGIQLARQLRRILPDIPILMVTAHRDPDLLMAKEYGYFDQLIHKPVAIEELRQAVVSCLAATERGGSGA